MSDLAFRVLLEVVGSQVVVLGGHECLEEAPRSSGKEAQFATGRFIEWLRLTTVSARYAPRDEPGQQPRVLRGVARSSFAPEN